MTEQENNEKRPFNNLPAPKFRTPSGEWITGEVVEQGFTPEGSGYRITQLSTAEQLTKLNAQEHIATLSFEKIVSGIENGIIVNPQAVERLYDLHAANQPDIEKVFNSTPNKLAYYCVNRAHDHTRYCEQRAEKDIAFYRNNPDYTDYPSYIFEAAADRYEIASRWYAMAARLVKRQERKKSKTTA